MIAVPWYLFAVGLLLLILGAISGAIFGSNRSSAKWIDPRMSDREIKKRLEEQSSVGFSGFLVYLGLACLLVSAVWRLLRLFIRV
ncbi:hypothetical protein [Paludisphaera rhizosphaerae]|uniref:hypothetical protein n=1 Tax=Paludisphaera rhizosphaerae TaxID=2711216 RepID=UPI0013EE1EFB|nr:hypothetical protein [Paludisphaera rhizosphaerae]